MNILDIFQLSYGIPSYFLYLLFTIRLGYKLIKREASFSNTFYILIFYKALVDLTLQTVVFTLSKSIKLFSFNNFFKKNSHLCSIFYLITPSCYTITFEIMFIMSSNRYIAIKQPLLYKSLFHNFQVIIYILISLIIGSSIGVYSSTFNCQYIYSEELKRIYISYASDNIAIFVLLYTFGFYAPLIIFSLFFNIITIKKLKSKNFKLKSNLTPDIRLLTYTLFSFIVAIIFLKIYMLRTISIFTKNNFFNIIGTYCMPIIVDIETYGSFYFSVFTNPQLLRMCFFKRTNEATSKVFTTSPKSLYLISKKKSRLY